MLLLLGPSAVAALVVFLAFVYLYHAHRERHVALWAIAWALFVVRYSYGIVLGDFVLGSEAVVLPVLALGRATFLLWGSLAMIGRRLPLAWTLLVAIDLVLVFVAAAGGIEVRVFGVPGVPTYTLFAAGLIGSGTIFWNAPSIAPLERRIAGGALFLFGLLQLGFPFYALLPQTTNDALYVLGTGVTLASGLGVILAYLKQSRMEALALRAELEEALTKVLAGHIPICMYCKSIRDEHDRWHRLESYVGANTEAQLSHGICPTCAAEHWGEQAG